MRTAHEIAALMATFEVSPESQTDQSAFRVSLAKEWGIVEGARVLEIGCGQGDTTAVLAEAVGETGSVFAVDLASPNYGAPVTVGDSMRHLKQGPLGNRLNFQFKFDCTSADSPFAPNEFDVIVLAHCTWYFESVAQVANVLKTIRPWAPKLCLSEWDLQPTNISQLGHLLAILAQGQVEAYKSTSSANVRSPYSRETLRSMLNTTGWSLTSDSVVDASRLLDGKWEMAACLAESNYEAAAYGLPPKLQALISSQIDIIRRLYDDGEHQPLNSYAITAAR